MSCAQPEKHRHKSLRAALKARDALETERGVDVALRPYKCGDHWHIGHKGMKNPKTMLARALREGRKNSRRRKRTR